MPCGWRAWIYGLSLAFLNMSHKRFSDFPSSQVEDIWGYEGKARAKHLSSSLDLQIVYFNLSVIYHLIISHIMSYHVISAPIIFPDLSCQGSCSIIAEVISAFSARSSGFSTCFCPINPTCYERKLVGFNEISEMISASPLPHGTSQLLMWAFPSTASHPQMAKISLDVAARILVELVAWTKLKASQQASTSKGLRTAGIAGHIFWSFWFFLHVWVRANSLKHVETTPWHHHSERRITGGPVDWVRDSLLRLFLLLHPHNLAFTKCKAERKCFLPGSMIWNDLKAWIISRKKISFSGLLGVFRTLHLQHGFGDIRWHIHHWPAERGPADGRPRRENMGNMANPPPKSTSYGRHGCNIS